MLKEEQDVRDQGEKSRSRYALEARGQADGHER